ncbi:MAG: right-handed parallel beta-helix repeat-containing protein [Chloroflexi bacterium]|nr:MAG: right-handed parallel beta-helix repeat-containing protein [Chloroflexota bacterium]MBL1195080.1 right-handed parallel beta-helix repeat-containing protein [Chloroflexota bacterium]NOH12367.1 right-handed parallel beta-helix repeat-containing protein [Chloroflexota bacterium]
MSNPVRSFTLFTGLLAVLLLSACTLPTPTPIIPLPVPDGIELPPLPLTGPIACTEGDLIAAINAANSTPAHDTIILAPGCVITLTTIDNNNGGRGDNGTPVIRTPITIQGGVSSAIQRDATAGTPAFRIFFVAGGAELTLDHLNILNGTASDGAGIYNDGGHVIIRNALMSDHAATNNGGAVMNNGGNLEVGAISFITDNQALNGGGIYNAAGIFTGDNLVLTANVVTGNGGGLYNDGPGVSASLMGVNFFENEADLGGGIYNNLGTINASSNQIVDNSARLGGGVFNDGTFTGQSQWYWMNRAGGRGGGLLNEGQATITHSLFEWNTAVETGAGIENSGELSLSNSTLSGNITAILSGAAILNGGTLVLDYVTIAENSGVTGGGGALFTGPATVTISNSIIANNSGGDCSLPAVGTTILKTNLDSDGSCPGFSLSGVLPMLGPLADNGGYPKTHALLPGSPALDSATGDCLPDDQRGLPRPGGAACDIGAYEAQLPALVPGLPEPGSPLIALVTENARCRSGPGFGYPDFDFFSAGDQLTVEGRSADSQWLYVKSLNHEGNCYVGAGVVELDAEPEVLEALPVPVPPPLPTPAPTPTSALEQPDSDGGDDGGQPPPNESSNPPAEPGNLYIQQQVCTSQEYSVALVWSDVADNEDGYRVYRNGQLIATLGANTQSYTDNPPYGGPYTYSVEAFNSTGANNAEVQEAGCIT